VADRVKLEMAAEAIAENVLPFEPESTSRPF
jgi:hypothetical protein